METKVISLSNVDYLNIRKEIFLKLFETNSLVGAMAETENLFDRLYSQNEEFLKNKEISQRISDWFYKQLNNGNLESRNIENLITNFKLSFCL